MEQHTRFHEKYPRHYARAVGINPVKCARYAPKMNYDKAFAIPKRAATYLVKSLQ